MAAITRTWSNQCVVVFIFTFVCVLSCVLGISHEGGQITWDPLPAEPKYNTTSEEPSLPLGSLFGLATGFIHKVPPTEVPWEILRGIINGTVDVTNDYAQFVSYSAGFITCFAIAIIFIILMPIIGVAFCCCRCCDNCGGKMLQRDKYNTQCRRVGLLVPLLFTTIMMTFGMICGFTSNAEMSSALQRADATLESNIKDISAYVNHTFEQFSFLAYNQYDYVHGLLISDLNNVGVLVAEPIKLAADPTVEPAIDAVIQLAKESEDIQHILREIVNTTLLLTEQAKLLQQALDMERDALNYTQGTAQCRSSLAPTCLLLRNTSNLHLLKLNVNYAIVRVETELAKVELALRENITELAYKGKTEYDNITSRIDGDSIGMVRDVKMQLENVRSSIQTEVDIVQREVDFQINKFLDLLLPDSPNSSANVFLNAFVEAQSYDQFRFFAGIALCCVILIIILCNYLGIIFGECGRDTRDRPTERGCLANMGGSFLLTGVTLIFMFSPFIMLATTLSFLAGGATEKAICKPMETGDIFREVIDYPYLIDPDLRYWLSAALYEIPNIPLTAEEIIRTCDANGAIYEAIDLDELFNLTAELDYRQKYPELQKQLDTFNISLTDLKLIDAHTQQRLNQFSASGVGALDYTRYLTEVRKGITGVNLTTTSTMIEMAASQIPDVSLQSQLKSHATNLRRIQEDTVAPMMGHVATLEQLLLKLQKKTVNIPDTINKSILAVLEAQDFVISRGGEIITQEIKTFADRLLGYVDQFVNHLTHVVHNDLGRCKPIANIYNSADVLICSYTVDSLNGFWLALGWCIFFFIPSIVLAVKLSKFYRRMRYFEDYFNTHDLETVPMKIYDR